MPYSAGGLYITPLAPSQKLVGYCHLYFTVGKKQTRKVKPLGEDHTELVTVLEPIAGLVCFTGSTHCFLPRK